MYSQETKTEFIRRVSTSTRGLVTICKDAGMPCVDTIMEWLRFDTDFRAMYDEAKAMQQELMFDEMMEIADDNEGDDLIKVNRDKLRIDARKWGMAKLAPKKYGDNKSVSVDVGVRSVTSNDQFNALRAEMKALITAPKVGDDAEDIEHEDVSLD